MSWWLILIVIIAGIGAGFLISNLILRRQDKGYNELQGQGSLAAPSQKPQPSVSKPVILTVEKSQPAVSKPAILSVEPFETKPVEKRQRPVMAEDTLEKFISKSKSPPVSVPPDLCLRARLLLLLPLPRIFLRHPHLKVLLSSNLKPIY
jgi:hypothetical protein